MSKRDYLRLLYLAALVGVVVPGARRAPLAPVPARAGRADAAAGVGVADVARLEAGRALGAAARREAPESGQAGVAAASADARAAVALPSHVVAVPVRLEEVILQIFQLIEYSLDTLPFCKAFEYKS